MIIIRIMSWKAITVATLLVPLLAAGCGSDEAPGDGQTLVASTGIVAEIAATVAGPTVAVEQLIPDGASPHDFQLSAQDRGKLDDADLVVANGAGLEAGIPLDETDAPRWELAENAGELLALEGEGEDPHVWMDPHRVAAALPSLAAALAELDPAHEAGFRRRAGEYADRLDELDRRLDEELAGVAADERKLITSHDSLGYFADRYGFDVVATAFSASGPEAEASAATLDELSDAIEQSGVAAVFAGEEDDPETLRLVADAAGVAVVDDLAIESAGATGTYTRMLKADAERIAAALAG